MPKLTKDGYEIGSSQGPVIVLHKNKYGDTRQKLLEKFRNILAGVEMLETRHINQRALRRGTHLEHGVASWAQEELEIMTSGNVKMWEPREAFQRRDLKIASSVDRIITLEKPVTLNDGEEAYTFEGDGICEIKTDFYHSGKPQPDWLIQVHHQLICTELSWGIIACLDQAGKLHFYPVPKDERLIELMLDNYADFWSRVESGEDYPPSVDKQNEWVDITDLLPKTNQDVVQLCRDYLRASAEESAWRKTKAEVKDNIVVVLDSLGVDLAKVANFEIKSVTKSKPKKEMVETGEYYDSLMFSVKEVSSE